MESKCPKREVPLSVLHQSFGTRSIRFMWGENIRDYVKGFQGFSKTGGQNIFFLLYLGNKICYIS